MSLTDDLTHSYMIKNVMDTPYDLINLFFKTDEKILKKREKVALSVNQPVYSRRRRYLSYN